MAHSGQNYGVVITHSFLLPYGQGLEGVVEVACGSVFNLVGTRACAIRPFPSILSRPRSHTLSPPLWHQARRGDGVLLSWGLGENTSHQPTTLPRPIPSLHLSMYHILHPIHPLFTAHPPHPLSSAHPPHPLSSGECGELGRPVPPMKRGTPDGTNIGSDSLWIHRIDLPPIYIYISILTSRPRNSLFSCTVFRTRPLHISVPHKHTTCRITVQE